MRYTNKHKLPRSIVDAVVRNTFEINKDQDSISVTMLNNPPRIRQLTIRHWDEIEEDIADNLWRLLGSAIHYILAKIPQEERFIEEILKEPILGMILRGRLDLYEGAEDKALVDHKVTSVWAVKSSKPEWVAQINCYAWFLRKLEFEVKKAYISAILRDWRKGESLKYKDYPKIPYKKINIKLWSFKEQQKYIEDRIKLHQSVTNLKDDKLPLCTDKERWYKENRCQNYCSVSKFCNYYREKYGR